jgi:cytochrome c
MQQRGRQHRTALRACQFGLAGSFALAFAACTTPEPTAAASPTRSGRALVERHCSACHAIGRSDSSRHASAPPFRRLSHNYPVSALEESLAEGIIVGHPDMPEFRFEAPEVAAIISYLESIQSP